MAEALCKPYVEAVSEGPLVLYDGVCNLCTWWVRFVLEHEREPTFRFAALQSAVARELAVAHGHDLSTAADPESVLLVEDGRIYERSTAALRITRGFRWPYRWLYAFVVVPRPLRDAVYAWIARHRYRWFGRKDACLVPTPELKARFLD